VEFKLETPFTFRKPPVTARTYPSQP